MVDREYRVSLDGDSVAVRSDNAPDAWNAWAVMNAINGGYWAAESQVAEWDIVTGLTPFVPAEPETPPGAPTPPAGPPPGDEE